MNTKDILNDIVSSHSTIITAKELVKQYSNMLEKGEITETEFTELMLDIQRSVNIQQHMIDLEELEKMNTAINSIITLARLIR